MSEREGNKTRELNILRRVLEKYCDVQILLDIDELSQTDLSIKVREGEAYQIFVTPVLNGKYSYCFIPYAQNAELRLAIAIYDNEDSAYVAISRKNLAYQIDEVTVSSIGIIIPFQPGIEEGLSLRFLNREGVDYQLNITSSSYILNDRVGRR